MNYLGHNAADDPWCFPDDAAAAARDATSSFADMLADYSTDNLFELASQQEGGGAGGAPGTSTVQPPAQSSLCPPPEVLFHPPSEDEMAAWLRAIVKGDELALNDIDDGRDVAVKGSSDASTIADEKQNHPITEEMGTKQLEMKNLPGEGSSRRSHHGEAHNLTEKRRRHKINERLRTLKQLVPGCDKQSNQASTLDQTIQYMKLLKHHVQEMSSGPARLVAAAAAVPIVPPQYAPPAAPHGVPMMPAAPMVIGPAPTTMVSFGAMLQMPHCPAAVPMMVPAAPAPLYPVADPARATVAAEDAGWSGRHRRHGSSRSKRKSSGSRRQKH
ncbi:unnamed protein product [Urochloa humidicola]